MKDPKTVMVTGAAGMIGSHLVDRLLSLGYVVYGFDIVNAAESHNLDDARDHPNFHYTQGDIRSAEVVKSFFRPEASCLYHLAGVVGVRKYMEDPLSLIDITIMGTRHFAALCEEAGVRMVFTSTSEVYGRNPAIPWKEDADRVLGATNVDRWSYSSSKAVCEHILFGIHHKSGWEMSIVRFFNIYGPRQQPIYVASQTVYRVLRGERPDIYDGGTQTRCFTSIDDVISGVISAGVDAAAVGQIINLGSMIETPVGDVVRLVLEHAGSDLEAVEVSTDDKYGAVYEDIIRRVPDSTKAERLLGWKASTPVSEGLRKTLEWAKANPWYLA